jgi:hypothetical protein
VKCCLHMVYEAGYPIWANNPAGWGTENADSVTAHIQPPAFDTAIMQGRLMQMHTNSGLKLAFRIYTVSTSAICFCRQLLSVPAQLHSWEPPCQRILVVLRPLGECGAFDHHLVDWPELCEAQTLLLTRENVSLRGTGYGHCRWVQWLHQMYSTALATPNC